MKADKLASFRLDNQLWEDFKAIAASNGTTASALLVSYIELVVNTGNVNTSIPPSIQSSIDNTPTISIQDIDKCIDDKIKTAIQDVNTVSIQDIDDTVKKQIKEALADGEIGEAIAKSYAAMMGQFNGLLEELQALQKQVQELQLNPPAAVPTVPSPQSPITNNQLPVTPEDVINFLAIEDILGGEEYWQEQLEIKGIDTKIKDNFEYFKSLGIEFKGVRDTAVSRFNCVLPWLGYKGTKQSTTIKQSNGLGVNKYIAVKVTK